MAGRKLQRQNVPLKRGRNQGSMSTFAKVVETRGAPLKSFSGACTLGAFQSFRS